MALESATYIDGLNVANPASGDGFGQADDHLRLLKQVLKNTFPNITGPVTQTQQKLNEHLIPIGMIAMWSGDPANLPTGWRLCDGGTYPKSDGSGNITVPDLRSKFIRGCGGSTSNPTAAPAVGATGGSATHDHVVTVNGTALTQAQLPNYNLTVSDPGHTHGVNDPGHRHTFTGPGTANGGPYLGGSVINGYNYSALTAYAYTGVSVNGAYTGISVNSGGSNATHTHTASVDTVSNLPPFYNLAFIIKI